MATQGTKNVYLIKAFSNEQIRCNYN